MMNSFFKLQRLLLAGMLLSTMALAESSSSSSGTSSSGTTLQVSEGSFTAATMPKTSDRAQKSKAASAAAKAGAAMQQVNCMRMQADAMAEEDPEAQMWKQMAAGMQCQQASQSQKSAEKNEEQSKALSGDDIPKPATFTPGSVNVVSSGTNESAIEIPTIDTSSKKSSGESTETKEEVAQKTEDTKALTGESTPKQEQSANVEAPLSVPKSALNAIESKPVVYDESAKNGQNNMMMNGAGLMPGNGAGANNGISKLEKTATTEQIAQEIADIERGIRSVNNGAGESAGSESEGGSKGSGILDALMAQLNPDAGGGMMMPFGESMQVVETENKETGTRINIFEYASYRYQMAATSQNRIDAKPDAKAKAIALKSQRPSRSPASLSQSVGTATDLLSASRAQ